MTHRMDNDQLLLMEDFKEYTVVSYTKLVEASQVTGQGFRLDFIQVFSQLIQAFNDSAADRLV